MVNFTHLKKFAGIMLLFAIHITSFAQPLELKIDAPASVAGRYKIQRSGFGPQDVNEIIGKSIKLTTPPIGCTAIAEDLTNSIAMMDRGVCAHYYKVKEAEKKNAVFALFCNFDDTPAYGPGMPTGVTDESVIKSGMLEKKDCDKLKIVINSSGLIGSIVLPECNPVTENVTNAIWGTKPGEGDFNGGPGLWTIDTDVNMGWEWSLWGNVGRGKFAGNGFIGSNSGCNGAMVFDSDFLDNGGDGAQGSGPCPGGSCNSSFTSPNISLAGKNVTGLAVQFTQAYRQYQSKFFLQASTDNGTTWTSYGVNEEAPVNSAAFTNDKVTIGLCGLDLAKEQVRLRFYMEGNYYYWAIDDVFLINSSSSDPQTNNFFATAPAFKTPASQVYNFPYLADIRNNGPLTSENTKLKASITKVDGGASDLIDSQDKDYASVDGCEQVENLPFDKLAKMSNQEGIYEIKYEISGKSNSNTNNDTRTAEFVVTDNSYSNCDNEIERGINYLRMFGNIVNSTFIGKNDMKAGTYYYFPKGKGYSAKEFYFGVEDNNTTTKLFSSILTMEVYKVLTGNLNNQDSLIDENEIVQVGYGVDPADHTLSDLFISDETPDRRRMKFDLVNDLGGELTLEDNTGYLFLISTAYLTGDIYGGTFHVFPFLGFSESDDPSFNTTAAEFAHNNVLGKERIYGTVLNNVDNLVGGVSVKIYNEVIIDKTSDVKDPLSETSVSIHPNPAATDLYFDLNLTKNSKKVNIELIDVTGKSVLNQNFENVKQQSVKINIAGLNRGIYMAKVVTEEGFITKKIFINE